MEDDRLQINLGLGYRNSPVGQRVRVNIHPGNTVGTGPHFSSFRTRDVLILSSLHVGYSTYHLSPIVIEAIQIPTDVITHPRVILHPHPHGSTIDGAQTRFSQHWLEMAPMSFIGDKSLGVIPNA